MSTDDTSTPAGELARLIEIMAALRTPETGCPWDLEQTFATIAPYTIEEAYEVADAIQRGDLADLKDELGDLLLQVVYHSRMAEEQGAFAFADVARAVNTKMIRRHPHVFGTAEERAAGAQPDFWATMKAAEKAEKEIERARLMTTKGSNPAPSPRTRGEGHAESMPRQTGEGQPQVPAQEPAPHVVSEARDQRSPLPVEGRGEGIASRVLADVPVSLPALTRAIKLQDKAARVGFDWPSLAPVFGKLKEELAEFEEVALPADPRGPTAASSQTLMPASDALPLPASDALPLPASGSLPMPASGSLPMPASGSLPLPASGALPLPASGRDAGSPSEAAERDTQAAIKEEFGDLLFVMANIARHLKLDPEDALRAANAKFTRRFSYVEARLADLGKTPEQSTLDEMDALWDEVRARDKMS